VLKRILAYIRGLPCSSNIFPKKVILTYMVRSSPSVYGPILKLIRGPTSVPVQLTCLTALLTPPARRRVIGEHMPLLRLVGGQVDSLDLHARSHFTGLPCGSNRFPSRSSHRLRLRLKNEPLGTPAG